MSLREVLEHPEHLPGHIKLALENIRHAFFIIDYI